MSLTVTGTCIYIPRVNVIFSGRGPLTFTEFLLVICPPSPRKVKPVSRGGRWGEGSVSPGVSVGVHEHLKMSADVFGGHV